MAKEVAHISFDEFAANVAGVFDRVIAGNESVVVEKPNGVRAVLQPAPRKGTRRGRTRADYEAFLAAAGSWKDVDTD